MNSSNHLDSTRRVLRVAVLAAMALLLGGPAMAGEVPTAPFQGFAIYSLSDPGYVNVPHHPDLNPASQITLEAWINTDFDFSINFENCMTIAGKGFTDHYSLGFCGRFLRSRVGGALVQSLGMELPANRWVHVAMTSDGSRRRHYVNGSLVTDVAEPGSMSANSKPFQIGQDPDYFEEFSGAIDEVRLWNRALSMEELRDYARFALQYQVQGLIAVWDFGPNEFFGNHDGTIVGNLAGLTDPLGACSSSSTTMCLLGRYTVEVEWSTNADSGQAAAVPPNSTDTALFWFFAPRNWEMMVKVIDGCGLNNRVWVYLAASTDQGYRVTVRDSLTGQEAIYTKAVGPPAPATTDSGALDVCNPF